MKYRRKKPRIYDPRVPIYTNLRLLFRRLIYGINIGKDSNGNDMWEFPQYYPIEDDYDRVQLVCEESPMKGSE